MDMLGFGAEAHFVRAMAEYIIACDDRGVQPDQRVNLMLPLYKFIRERVMIPCFPTYGKTTKCGLNFQLAEDILCSIQGRLCLYLILPDIG